MTGSNRRRAWTIGFGLSPSNWSKPKTGAPVARRASRCQENRRSGRLADFRAGGTSARRAIARGVRAGATAGRGGLSAGKSGREKNFATARSRPRGAGVVGVAAFRGRATRLGRRWFRANAASGKSQRGGVRRERRLAPWRDARRQTAERIVAEALAAKWIHGSSFLKRWPAI